MKYFLLLTLFTSFVTSLSNTNSTIVLSKTQSCDFECSVTECYQARLQCYFNITNVAISRLTDVISEQLDLLSSRLVEFQHIVSGFIDQTIGVKEQVSTTTLSPVIDTTTISESSHGLFSHALLNRRDNIDRSVVRSVLPSKTLPLKVRHNHKLYCWLCAYPDGSTIEWCVKRFRYDLVRC